MLTFKYYVKRNLVSPGNDYFFSLGDKNKAKFLRTKAQGSDKIGLLVKMCQLCTYLGTNQVNKRRSNVLKMLMQHIDFWCQNVWYEFWTRSCPILGH